MARIRTIKPEFWTDEALTECSMSARLLFIGTLNFADDNGNIEASAKQLKMKVFPADNIDCLPLLNELITHGLLIEYSVNGVKYLNIKGFTKHQVINRPSKSNIPDIDFSDSSMSTHGELPDGREGKGRERKVRERKSEISLKEFLDQCRTNNEKPIIDTDPIFDWAEAAEIPLEFLHIAWRIFKDKFIVDDKKQKDWRSTFRNYVKLDYLKVWYFKDGQCLLTTAGIAKQNEMKKA